MTSKIRNILELFSERQLKGILKEFNITPKERALLKELLSRIDEFALKETIKDFIYFKQLFEADIDPSYLLNRVQVGISHESKGIPLRSYIATFSKWLNLIYELVKGLVPSEDIPAILVALFKNILLDIALSVESYHTKFRTAFAKYYEVIFDSMKDAVVSVELETGIIKMVNHKISQLLGMPKDRLLGKRLSDICSVDARGLIKEEPRQIYLKDKDKRIPVSADVNVVELEGKKYAIFVFKDIMDEMKRKDEIEILGRLYNTLSSINILVTTVEEKSTFFKKAVQIIKDKGGFKYVGLFEKESGLTLYKDGIYSKEDTALCLPFKGGREEYFLEVAVSKEKKFTEREKALLEEIVHDFSFALEKLIRQEKDRSFGIL